MTFKPTYAPKNSLSNLSLNKEILEKIDKIKNLDINSLVNSIDTKPIEIEIATIMAQAENKALNLEQKIISDIEKDFCDNLQLYGFMVKNKIEKDYFPFYEWLKYMDEVEKKNNLKINMKYQNVFDMVLDISETDVSLSKGNLAYYLSKLPGKINNPNTFFSELEKFVSENFTSANFLNMMSGADTYSIHKGLNGNDVPVAESSQLIYCYAVTIPNSSWAFKHQHFKGGLTISSSTSNYHEIYEEFIKTDIWKRINFSHESRKKFVKEMLNADLKEKPFFEYYHSSSSIKGIREIKWDNLKAFTNHIIKDDVELAEFMMYEILSKVHNKENHNAQALQIVNIALQYQLQKDLSVAEIKEKKLKL